MLRSFVPHLFTLANLFCGSIAVILAVQNHLVFASVFVGIGIFFDFFDGFFARLLDVTSSLGVQLDSMADLITSGLAPAVVMVQLIAQSAGSNSDIVIYNWEEIPSFHFSLPLVSLIGLLVVLSSAYRLGKFNIDERQTTAFIGLPTPANAVMIMSLPLILTYQDFPRITSILFNQWVLIGLTVFGSILLNVELRMFSLKFKNWSFKDNWYRYILLIFSLVLVLSIQFLAFPLIVLTYVLFSAILDYVDVEY